MEFFLENYAANYFLRKLHLRCLTEFCLSLGVIQKLGNAKHKNINILKPPIRTGTWHIRGLQYFNVINFCVAYFWMSPWVLRPVDTYLFNFNNNYRTIVTHVFLLIFCWFLKFLVVIGKKINNLCWLIQTQDLLKKWKLFFYLTCFFTSEVFFYHCQDLFKTFKDVRNNRSSH